MDIHDFRSASVWILSEAGIKFSPTFPQTTFVWLKLHKNGTVYCPQGDARAQADQSWGLQPKGNGVHSEQLSPRATVAAQTRCAKNFARSWRGFGTWFLPCGPASGDSVVFAGETVH